MCRKGQGDLSCPQCRKCFSLNLKPNLILANIVERLKEIDKEASQQSRRQETSEENKKFYCEEHEEKLKLFCEEDQKAICMVCGASRSHKSHNLMPIKEAFEIYKRKVQGSLRGLQSELKEAYRCQEDGRNKNKKLQDKVDCLKRQIREEFSELHEFLNEEERNLRTKVEQEETEILQRLEDYESKTAQEITKLELLRTKLQKKLSSREEELVKDIKATLAEAEVKFEKPESSNADLCDGKFVGLLQYRAWRRMRDIIDCPVLDSITIDPRTAHPELIISDNGTSLRCGSEQRDVPDSLQRFTNYYAALGSKGFTSGKHYWEVEVGDKRGWILGVARESVARKPKVPLLTMNGFYILYKNEKRYRIDNTGVPGLPPADLPITVEPRRIGVYLDYDGGQVSLYNADDMSLVHTYTDTFTERMYPYFDVVWSMLGENQKPLKLVTPKG
nr:PREDICTED: E3 ubiquitin-protein ligase TRIM39-like [Latimeria chalumnae]|eukprot:XP_014345221.1 PREDICTED: E3 ubiquitin-protein ligase TRIM39-like [Latimeria chalumnae]